MITNFLKKTSFQTKEVTMNKNFNYLLAAVAILCLFSIKSIAQVTTDKVIVTQDYKPTIADAFKLNDNPSIKDTTPPIPALKYPIITKYIDRKLNLSAINPATMKGEPLTKLYRGYVKAGLGTYSSPYGEFFINNLRSKKYSIGAHAKHFSSKATLNDVGFAGFSDNNVRLYGKYFVPNHILSAETNFNSNLIHYYGFNSNIYDSDSLKNETKERYTNIDGKVRFESTYKDSSAFNHDIGLTYYNFSDIGSTVENNFKVTVTGSKYLTKELIGGTISFDYYDYKYTGKPTTAGIVLINPFVKFSGTKWQANMGINTTIETDQSKTHFLPNLTFKYNVVENIFAAYAELVGTTKRNSFKSLAMENPFIVHTLPLKNTTTKADAKIGFRGSYSSKLAFNVFGSYQICEQMPLFTSYAANTLQNKFTVVYDDINIVTVHGEVSYTQKEKLNISLKANYFNYTTSNEAKAWYKPVFEVGLFGKYNLEDKFLVSLDIFTIGNQIAQLNELDVITGSTLVSQKTLKGITDINVGAEYRYNKKLSAFVRFNNIAGMRYYRWNNYPTQKFNLMGGLTFSF